MKYPIGHPFGSWPRTGRTPHLPLSSRRLPPSPCFPSLNSHSSSSSSLLLPSETQSTLLSLVVPQVIVTSTTIFLQRSICRASTTTHLMERGRALHHQYRPSTRYKRQSIATYLNKFIVFLAIRYKLSCTHEHRNTVSQSDNVS
jgi:hypothetical protein